MVAGLISDHQRIICQIEFSNERNIGTDEACIIGQCTWLFHDQSHLASSSSSVDSSSTIWLDIRLPRYQTSTKLGKSHTYPLIAGLRAPLVGGSSVQCAINVVLYVIPRAERIKYFSLEPIVLPTASSAGILDTDKGAPESTKDHHLQRRLEDLVRLDPFRYKDMTSEYLRNRGPGQGFRRAVELVSTNVSKRHQVND